MGKWFGVVVATDLSHFATYRLAELHLKMRWFCSFIASSCCNFLSNLFSQRIVVTKISTQTVCIAIALYHYVTSTKCDTELKSTCQYPFANPKKMFENHVCTIHNMFCPTNHRWDEYNLLGLRLVRLLGGVVVRLSMHLRGSSTAGVGCIRISLFVLWLDRLRLRQPHCNGATLSRLLTCCSLNSVGANILIWPPLQPRRSGRILANQRKDGIGIHINRANSRQFGRAQHTSTNTTGFFTVHSCFFHSLSQNPHSPNAE